MTQTTFSDLASELDGLGQLRTLSGAGPIAPIEKTLNFRLVEIEHGRVVFEGAPEPSVYNPMGSVHGGYTATLLDSACGCAVQSRLEKNQGQTTVELKVSYHRAITKDSGVVRAEGKVLSMGRRVAFAEAKLIDASGRLCASATSTLLIFPLNGRPAAD